MPKGDIVLISFPFTDLTGSKLRPAVILFESDSDLTVAFVTTQLAWREETDLLVNPSQLNRLKKPSLIRTNKLATLDNSLAKGLLGSLSTTELKELDVKLKTLFRL